MIHQIVLVEKKAKIKIKVHLYLHLKEQQQENFINLNATFFVNKIFSCKINLYFILFI